MLRLRSAYPPTLAPEGPARPHVALSTEPQDVERSVLVPMQTLSTLRAFVPTHGQALVDEDTTTRTSLRGERRRHAYHCLPSLYRFARQDGQETAPARVADTLGEQVVLDQVGRLHVFVVDRV